MSANKAVNALIRKYEQLPDLIAKGYMALVVTTVNQAVDEFVNSVENTTPVAQGDLKNSLKAKPRYDRKRGTWGYRVVFDGYKTGTRVRTGSQWEVPFQVIANTLNKGKRETDDGRVVSLPRDVGFIEKNLQILRQINPKLAENIVIGGWSIDDNGITINDGQRFTMQQLNNFVEILNEHAE